MTQSSILTEINSLGNLELIRYNFQEITEVKNISETINILGFDYKPFPDNKAVLISRGEAVGCLDLMKLSKKDISVSEDTLFLKLPAPELCYFKIDLQKSKLYDLQTDFMSTDEKLNFIQLLYQKSEKQIKESALSSGILSNTQSNAQLILAPLLKKITNKEIVFLKEVEKDSVLLR